MATIPDPGISRSGTFRLAVTPSSRLSGVKVVSEKTLALRKNYIAPNVRVTGGARILRKEAMYAASPEFPLGTTDTTGHYAAVVKQNGVPLANCRVALYWRDNMQLIAKAVSNENGEFRFDGLIPNINRYFAIALDPDGGVLQNALIYDRIMPIK